MPRGVIKCYAYGSIGGDEANQGKLKLNKDSSDSFECNNGDNKGNDKSPFNTQNEGDKSFACPQKKKPNA